MPSGRPQVYDVPHLRAKEAWDLTCSNCDTHNIEYRRLFSNVGVYKDIDWSVRCMSCGSTLAHVPKTREKV